MTREIPADSRNITVNAPMAWFQAVNRAAFGRDLSRGEFIRQCVERCMEYEEPGTADQLRAARGLSVRRKLTIAAILIFGFWLASSVVREAAPGKPIHREIFADTVNSIDMNRIRR